MNTTRWTHLRGAMAFASLVLVTPASACASPLLSGYGGPGQGSQALLGSTLLGGGRGGSGSGGSSGTAGSTAQAPIAAASSGENSASLAGSSGRARARAGADRGARSNNRAFEGPIAGRSRLLPVSLARSADIGSLGLSAMDLALVAVAIAVMAATGLLMGRMSRRAQLGGPGG